ncbi:MULTISPECIES: TIR domain-containing protein [Burkholderiaceae]|uniref:TIR domain-containing protein n=1 Tax=Burkholderiaceae TaxID=119060 RepID=UPI00052EAA3C|nr:MULTISPECIES: toll/interleukin-1 receptor domain-containing protein [Burkholderiaceae]KWU23808.1 hypothetical protein AS149_35275 [Burkholderia cenocepacia]
MVNIFFSYSHKDEVVRNELEAHLASLRHQGLIESWHDRRITAGDEVDNAIFEKLESANIILLLVSSDFINSSYCYSKEMERAMERHRAGTARVIPIIVRHCDWMRTPFGKLLAAPRDGKPILSWPDRDEALADVARQIREAVEALGGTGTNTFSTSVTTPTKLASDLPRSSNLRLPEEFTEKDFDDFIRTTFSYICRFFQGSVEAVGERNPGVTGTFEQIDSRRMITILYRGGKKIAEGSVRLGSMGRTGGIAFSPDASASENSFNEMLTPHAGEHSLYFQAMGMSYGSTRDKHLSQEGAAEFLWELLIAQARR